MPSAASAVATSSRVAASGFMRSVVVGVVLLKASQASTASSGSRASQRATSHGGWACTTARYSAHSSGHASTGPSGRAGRPRPRRRTDGGARRSPDRRRWSCAPRAPARRRRGPPPMAAPASGTATDTPRAGARAARRDPASPAASATAARWRHRAATASAPSPRRVRAAARRHAGRRFRAGRRRAPRQGRGGRRPPGPARQTPPGEPARSRRPARVANGEPAAGLERRRREWSAALELEDRRGATPGRHRRRCRCHQRRPSRRCRARPSLGTFGTTLRWAITRRPPQLNDARGQGCRPRTWSCSAGAGRRKSIGASARVIFGA